MLPRGSSMQAACRVTQERNTGYSGECRDEQRAISRKKEALLLDMILLQVSSLAAEHS